MLQDETANNFSFLVNQQDLCEDVVGKKVLLDIAQGQAVADFTLVEHKYFVLLLQNGLLLVFDCDTLFTHQQEHVRYLQTIDLCEQVALQYLSSVDR